MQIHYSLYTVVVLHKISSVTVYGVIVQIQTVIGMEHSVTGIVLIARKSSENELWLSYSRAIHKKTLSLLKAVSA